MQWLLNAVLAVECLSMPFFAAGAVAGVVWYGGRRMGGDWGWVAGGGSAAGGGISSPVSDSRSAGWVRSTRRNSSRP